MDLRETIMQGEISPSVNSQRTSWTAQIADFFLVLMLVACFTGSACFARQVVSPRYSLAEILSLQMLMVGILAALNIFSGRKALQLPCKQSTDGIAVCLMSFVLIAVISAFLNSSLLSGNYTLTTLLTAPFFYYALRAVPSNLLSRSAMISAVLYVAFMWNAENSNVFAFSLIGLTIIAMPALLFLAYPLLLMALGVTFYYCRFESSVAVIVIFLFLNFWQDRRLRLMALLIIPIAVGFTFSLRGANFINSRLSLLEHALNMFVSSPVLGVGPGHIFIEYLNGVFYENPHAHCFLATVAAQFGSLGLLCIGVLLFEIFQRWNKFPLWGQGFLLAFAAFGLQDDPVWWWGATIMIMAVLSRGWLNKSA